MNRLQIVTVLRAAAVGGVAAALSLTSLPVAHAGITKQQPVRGLDISAYQHTGDPIDWGLLTEAGIRFAAIKVSEGTYYTNRYYQQDARDAVKAGLAVMPYVFANPGRAKGLTTARFAVKTEGKQRGQLPLVVDLENNPYTNTGDCYGLSIPAMVNWITGFTQQIKRLTGTSPTIYTTAAWWQECTGNTSKFRESPLWLAAFGGTQPTAPPTWDQWTFWQYDNDGTLPGLDQVDLDYYQPTSTLPALTPKPKPKPNPKHKPKAKTAQKPKPPAKPKPRASKHPAPKPKHHPSNPKRAASH